MRVMKRIAVLSLLVVATLFIQNASAAVLPFSTFGATAGWQGTRSYDVDLGDGSVLSGRVDYTVFDRENLQLEGETLLAEAWEKPGRYIYAYQIWNDPELIDDEVLNEAILFFAVFNVDKVTAMDVDSESIGSIADTPSNGVEPTITDLMVGNLKVIWGFAGGGIGEAILLAGEHSYFLMFSSHSGPVVGDFEVEPVAEDGEFPVPDIPEPAMITLVGIGSVIMFIKRRKSVL